MKTKMNKEANEPIEFEKFTDKELAEALVFPHTPTLEQEREAITFWEQRKKQA